MCIKCDLKSVSYKLALESGTARQADSHGGTVKASINVQLVKIRIVLSVDWEYGTGMDYIAPASTKYPMTQGVYYIVSAMNKKNECHLSMNVCLNNSAKGTNPIFLLCRLKINHMMRHKLCIYLRWL
jgi:hypothetical protein